MCLNVFLKEMFSVNDRFFSCFTFTRVAFPFSFPVTDLFLLLPSFMSQRLLSGLF